MLIYLLGGCRGQGPLIQGLVGWLAASVLQPANGTSSVGTGHARDQSAPVPLILALYQRRFWACLFVCQAAVADIVRSYKVQLSLGRG